MISPFTPSPDAVHPLRALVLTFSDCLARWIVLFFIVVFLDLIPYYFIEFRYFIPALH